MTESRREVREKLRQAGRKVKKVVSRWLPMDAEFNAEWDRKQAAKEARKNGQIWQVNPVDGFLDLIDEDDFHVASAYSAPMFLGSAQQKYISERLGNRR